MSEINQCQLVLKNKSNLAGPFLEIGSRDYERTQKLRSFFPDQEYIGLDIFEGDGVDVIVDLTQPFALVDKALGGKRFGTIFSLSVIEHCENPFQMASNMEKLLKPGGKIVLSVPFAWRSFDHHPDYWRFTKEGVKNLFPHIIWSGARGAGWRVFRAANKAKPDKKIGLLPLIGKHYRKNGVLLKGMAAGLLKIPRTPRLPRWLPSNRYRLPPERIDMIGVRAEDA
jgi:SAM-dependent methyltransferase